MATRDPRTTMMTIVVDHLGAILKDDNIAAADVLMMWSGGPETLYSLFYGSAVGGPYDVVITFGPTEASRSLREVQSIPVHYNMKYPVIVTTVDKPMTGALLCTATEMQWKVTYALRNAIEVHAKSAIGVPPAYTLTIVTGNTTFKRVGGLDIYESRHVLEYVSDNA